MSEQEIYEITRNYAVVTAVFLMVSVFGIYLSLKRKDDHLLGIVTSVFQIAISFAMLNMNFTITLIHLSLIHISEPTRQDRPSRMPSSA